MPNLQFEQMVTEMTITHIKCLNTELMKGGLSVEQNNVTIHHVPFYKIPRS